MLPHRDHDVFGDGSVRIILAPGHTPGHQVLLLDLEINGPLMLSGDLYHTRANRELRRALTFAGAALKPGPTAPGRRASHRGG